MKYINEIFHEKELTNSQFLGLYYGPLPPKSIAVGVNCGSIISKGSGPGLGPGPGLGIGMGLGLGSGMGLGLGHGPGGHGHG